MQACLQVGLVVQECVLHALSISGPPETLCPVGAPLLQGQVGQQVPGQLHEL